MMLVPRPVRGSRAAHGGRTMLPLLMGLGIAQLLMATTLALAARWLSPGPFGQAMAVAGIGALVTTVLDFGSATHAIRSLAAGGIEAEREHEARSVGRGVVTALVCAGATFWWLLLPEGVAIFAFSLLIGAGISTQQYALAPLRARSSMTAVAVVLVLDKSTTLGLLALYAWSGPLTSWSLLVALTAGPFVSTACTVLISRALRMSRTPRRSWRVASPWRGGGRLGIAVLASGAQQLDTVLVSQAAGATAAGQYAAVSRWATPVMLVSTSLTQSAFPRMTSAENHECAWRHLRRQLPVLLMPAMALTLLAAFAPLVVEVVLGPAYVASVDVLRLLVFGLLLAMVNQPLSGLLQARGRDTWVAVALSASVTLQLIMMTVLSAWAGPVGASVGLGVGQGLLLLLLSVGVIRLLRPPAAAEVESAPTRLRSP